jgi:hypothetical protein
MKIKSFNDYSPTLQPLYKELDYSEYNKVDNFGELFIIDSFGSFSFDVRIKVDYNNLNEWILENYPEILK